MPGSITVALRSADAELVDHVREVTQWWSAQLLVRPPGSPPPPADVHVDSHPERQAGDPPWARAGGIKVTRASDAPLPGVIPLPEGALQLADAISVALATRDCRTIGVTAARGGAGASVVAALLARAIARDRKAAVALVDLAGGLEHLLAIEDEAGPRWADLDERSGPFVGEQLVATLPRWGRVAVLGMDSRGLGSSSPASAATAPAGAPLAALRDAVGVLVLDAGRALPALPCADLLVVTTPEPGAVLGARSLVAAAAGTARVRVVLRQLPGVSADPREVADICGAEVVAQFPHSRLLAGDLARGLSPGDRPRSRLVRASRALARELLP